MILFDDVIICILWTISIQIMGFCDLILIDDSFCALVFEYMTSLR